MLTFWLWPFFSLEISEVETRLMALPVWPVSLAITEWSACSQPTAAVGFCSEWTAGLKHINSCLNWGNMWRKARKQYVNKKKCQSRDQEPKRNSGAGRYNTWSKFTREIQMQIGAGTRIRERKDRTVEILKSEEEKGNSWKVNHGIKFMWEPLGQPMHTFEVQEGEERERGR